VPGRGEGAGDGVLAGVAEDDVDAAARGFHGAVQILTGAHTRRGDPGDLAEEQRARLGRADGRAAAHEVGGGRPGEQRRQGAYPRCQLGLRGGEDPAEPGPPVVDPAAVPRVGEDAQRGDGGGVADRGGVAVREGTEAEYGAGRLGDR
jgi:hypothetical protein